MRLSVAVIRVGVVVFATVFLATALVAEEAAQRYAVLVGIEDYFDSSLVKLKTARNDAKDLGALLAAPGSGWDKVFVMTDDLDTRSPDCPLRSNIEKRLGLLADLAKPSDTILLFLSGHGVSDTEGDGWFLPLDADFGRWRETALRIPSLVETLTSRGLTNIILTVDACREAVTKTKGLSVVGVTGSAARQGRGGPKLAFYSTQAGWFSYEDKAGRNGVFTKFMLEGLGGAADLDRDGTVSFTELAAWLPQAVSSYALDEGIRQKPVVTGSGSGLGGIKAGLASGPGPGAAAASAGRTSRLAKASFDPAGAGLMQEKGSELFVVDKTGSGHSDGVILATKAGRFGNFSLEATIQPLAGPANYGNGLIFRAAENGKGYLFNVTADGRFAFYRYDIPSDGYSWYSFIQGQTSAKVPSEAVRVNGPNTLKAIVRDSRVQLFINGSPVGSVDMELNGEGLIGVYVSAGNKVEFRGLRIEP
jgi:hypothetical protein